MGLSVIVFGATGMVGQGVVRECIASPEVDYVVLIGRTRAGVDDAKVHEVVVPDLAEVDAYEPVFDGIDACYFCVGVTSAGRTEDEYTRITYDLTLAVARAVARRSPGATFAYVSGAGTNAAGRSMWARVKGRTEQALLGLPLDAYMLRPGFINPMHGERSGTRLYRVAYAAVSPLYPILRRVAPGAVTSTEQVGRAMVALALRGWRKRTLETRDINAIDPIAATMPRSTRYAPGSTIAVRLVKSGQLKVGYDATVRSDDGNHLVVEAPWVGEQPRDLGPVTFGPGDVFTEHYWQDRWYSVKEVRDPAGVRKGWYCDVCRPAVRRPTSVYAEDLELDLWVSDDLSTRVRLDEDEFVASGLAVREPSAAAQARAALDALEALAADRFASVIGKPGS
ncbi:MAG TPA: DUF402 domain-containing protein [Micromonosporaceae bacterium]|nr:DUF402 domain-containing protein [Micromonosporaceae bacterium]